MNSPLDEMEPPVDVKPTRRKWPWFLGGAVVLIVLVVVAAPFIYIHFIQADPPPSLTFENRDAASTTEPATSASTAAGAASGAANPATTAPAATNATAGSVATGAAAGSVDGTWTVTTGSEAGYRVKEVLFGQSTDAVGRTSTVTGTMTIAKETVTQGSFSVDLRTVTSDESQRDRQFQGSIMHTSQFPLATFELTSPIDLGTLPADKVQMTYEATGKFTLHGTTKSVQVPLTARRNGANIEVSGTIPVVFADYGIANPSNSAAKTEDNGVVEFLLVLAVNS
jgi:polyisoprenoid-binding protein YceI